ncbi:helix-turn-helix domain-containing protein [Clavibacter michiganensis]|uniref:XRE family transcriptional regulator n=1 Tax=Clavibacter michiganensis subsp. insidiosus TaxID=33014 RepID=A0A0D5CNF2_9MICO|nr:XRE family transcriptional regulator [Clavibacter michiganensis]AJW80770.1 XRE family transcriptional regulator [Clavibacter michiganensis subsp. insidiosus]AWF99908.1 XRE family transcriptional regulator [Clavibacter michiganensis subsp. insidiosus]RIJ45083.1 XRE family transcriptional regulator [Clavibacter michiganensis subsp. insidiosus]
MGAVTSELALRIGNRVRASRRAQGWTLDQMAERSGVSRRMVVLVEKGQTNPSVTTLLLLSDALGIGLPTLVAEHEGMPAALTHRGDGSVLWTSERGGSGTLLAGTPSPDVLELWEWHLAAGDAHESAAHTPGTREILHVTDGSLTLTTGDEQRVLNVGDTCAFDGDQPHAYANASISSAGFTLAVFEPNVRAGHDDLGRRS